MGDMDELVNDFLVESYENLDRLDHGFVELEKDPGNHEHIASIFRNVHTIKGTSGFFGFEKLEKVTHAGENLLSKLRDRKLDLTTDMTTALLEMVDAVRAILGRIERDKDEGPDDYLSLIGRLELLQEGSGAAAAKVSTPIEQESELSPASFTSTSNALAHKTDGHSHDVDMSAYQVESLKRILTTRRHRRQADEAARQVDLSAAKEELPPPTTRPRTEEVAKADLEAQARAAINEAHGVADTTIRVDVKLLDQLMNLVGELVLVRNRILQFEIEGNTEFQTTTQRLNVLTSELQEGVMKTRMQPIGNVWSKFPRVVRDLSRMCGKQVRIEMEGAETELDKSLIEAIKDPLTHIVRNSVDHGIELPDKRLAAGKLAEGVLKLRAFHEGGMVNIEIIDDGAGINVERVRAKAIEKGLITADQAARMGERELVNLIFMPGFSTAEKVTNISGRGVGMDVVKTNIERIGGTVDIQTKLGSGSTLRIKIPLTLAIVPALIVATGGERFAIPQVSLLELVRLEGEQLRTGIETVYGAEVYRLRGQLLPIIRLNQVLGLGTDDAAADSLNIVVLQADERTFGLVVDAVCDSEEIVVKPLSKMLKSLAVFAGATIMGDGQVALILDVIGLGQRSHVVTANKDRATQAVAGKSAQGTDDQQQVLLVFESPDDGRMAIPISRIARLEEMPISSLERAGDRSVVQYRGSILPLIHVFDLLPERRKEARKTTGSTAGVLPVVVVRQGERSVGLVIGRIIDTVVGSTRVTRSASRTGVLGCVVLNDRITELLDVEGVIVSTIPDFFAADAAGART
jgi:two-component system chemotaxis sensor kinase CheA